MPAEKDETIRPTEEVNMHKSNFTHLNHNQISYLPTNMTSPLTITRYLTGVTTNVSTGIITEGSVKEMNEKRKSISSPKRPISAAAKELL